VVSPTNISSFRRSPPLGRIGPLTPARCIFRLWYQIPMGIIARPPKNKTGNIRFASIPAYGWFISSCHQEGSSISHKMNPVLTRTTPIRLVALLARYPTGKRRNIPHLQGQSHRQRKSADLCSARTFPGAKSPNVALEWVIYPSIEAERVGCYNPYACCRVKWDRAKQVGGLSH
jgi:hypothetical protein